MTDSNETTIAAMFKRTEGGWIYRAPNPRIFGDSPHYILSESQRAEIIGILTPRHPARTIALLIALIVVCPLAMTALVWTFGSGAKEPTAWDIAAIAGLVLVSLLPVLPALVWLQLRRVRPVLAGAPMTGDRITAAEIQRDMRAAMTGKSTLNACVASVFACVASAGASGFNFLYGHTGQAIFWAIITTVWALLAMRWYRLTLSKVS